MLYNLGEIFASLRCKILLQYLICDMQHTITSWVLKLKWYLWDFSQHLPSSQDLNEQGQPMPRQRKTQAPIKIKLIPRYKLILGWARLAMQGLIIQ